MLTTLSAVESAPCSPAWKMKCGTENTSERAERRHRELPTEQHCRDARAAARVPGRCSRSRARGARRTGPVPRPNAGLSPGKSCTSCAAQTAPTPPTTTTGTPSAIRPPRIRSRCLSIRSLPVLTSPPRFLAAGVPAGERSMARRFPSLAGAVRLAGAGLCSARPSAGARVRPYVKRRHAEGHPHACRDDRWHGGPPMVDQNVTIEGGKITAIRPGADPSPGEAPRSSISGIRGHAGDRRHARPLVRAGPPGISAPTTTTTARECFDGSSVLGASPVSREWRHDHPHRGQYRGVYGLRLKQRDRRGPRARGRTSM